MEQNTDLGVVPPTATPAANPPVTNKKGSPPSKKVDLAPPSRASVLAGLVRAKMKDQEAVQLISRDSIQKIKAISTGSLGLDMAIGIGGFPEGRIVEIFGPESSGKSTICLQAVASCQAAGGVASYIDAEHAFDPTYAVNLGVKLEDMLLAQPSNGEEGLSICEVLVENGKPGDLVVVDSVAALTPKAEIEGEMGDSVPGDTPVVVRRYNKFVDIVSIASLYGGDYKFIGKRYTKRYKKLKHVEVLTANGWKNATCIVLKHNVAYKPVIVTNSLNGLAITTKDHSLFVNGQEKSPAELKLGDHLDVRTPVLGALKLKSPNYDIAWIIGYFCAEGSKHEKTANVFSFYDTTKSHVDQCEQRIRENFLAYTRCDVTKHDKVSSDGSRRVDIFDLYVSGDETLSSFLNSCIDRKTGLKRVPSCILNGGYETKRGFLDGYKTGDGIVKRDLYSFSTSSFLMLAGVTYIFQELGFKFHINSNYRAYKDEKRKNTNPEFSITQVKENAKHECEITKFIELPPPEHLYDIETEDGTFVGGAGGIVHHNSHMGLQARMMGQALRKIVAYSHNNGVTVLFVNQLRQKIGVMFGNPEVTSGGNALKFYASVRLDIRRISQNKVGEEVVSNRTRVKVIKNKVAPPFKQVEFDIRFGTGVDYRSEMIELGVQHKIIEQSGSWYSFNGDKIANGKEATIQALAANPDLDQIIYKTVREAILKGK